MSEEPTAPSGTANRLEKTLAEINFATSNDQLEKLRLLAACVVAPGLILEKNIPEIFHVIKTKRGEKGNAVAVYKRLLNKAGISKKDVDKLLNFMVPSQVTEDLPNLYFTEVLVEVSDHIGNGESFRDLKNIVPSDKLNIHGDNIPTCVRLFQLLLQKDILNTSDPNESLKLLAGWLTDIYRSDVAKIVRKYIIDQSATGSLQDGIQPQGDGDLTHPVQETQTQQNH